MFDPNAPRSERLGAKQASALLAPQLADVFLRFEARLNGMADANRWSPEDVKAAIDSVDLPLWWLNDTMGGQRPGVHFEVPASEIVADGAVLDAEVAREIGPVLDKACARLQQIQRRQEREAGFRPGEDELRQLLRDVRYAANDLRRALHDITPSGPGVG